MMTVKQFGLERTGTNYLGALLLFNYDIDLDVNRRRWKHTLIPLDEVDYWDHCVITCKHPLAWFNSILNFFHLRELTAIPEYVIAYWAAFTQYYDLLLEVKPDNFTRIKYEDLLVDSEAALSVLDAKGLKRKTVSWFDITDRIHSSHTPIHPDYTPVKFDKEYYTEKRYLQDIREDWLKQCVARLKPHAKLLTKLGYDDTLALAD